ncbi:unnamed protein product [Clavelina lepadiformis]|uniref:Mitochondrial import inner membrane translocase subunit n=1 Tax=Clavelina lepadiformis TaxID=159417 RepID=A0ABP0G0R1_CLALP
MSGQMVVDSPSQLRNIKDFLILYNALTESCFNKCVTNMNYRTLTQIERACVHRCADKFTNANKRFMNEFTKLTPEMIRRRNEDAMEQAQKYEALLQESAPSPTT